MKLKNLILIFTCLFNLFIKSADLEKPNDFAYFYFDEENFELFKNSILKKSICLPGSILYSFKSEKDFPIDAITIDESDKIASILFSKILKNSEIQVIFDKFGIKFLNKLGEDYEPNEKKLK